MPDSVFAPSGRGAGDRLTAPLFELERVSLARGGRPVLRELDLAIEPGATAVLGPSGSGKSSLLRLLDRLADPDEGSVRFRGDDVRELDPLDLRRRAVLVPQLPAPVPGTVADNVRYGPRLIGREVEPARFLELAELAPSFAERDAERLSVGEQQRVMLARALALEPEVLLLDGLRGQSGLSLVLVTHERGQAERLAERVVELNEGRLA